MSSGPYRPMMPRVATLGQMLGIHPVASHPPEDQFQDWFADAVKQYGIDPDSNDVYDYRSAMMAGATPDRTGHWPSDFKRENHPNIVVGGFNTKTGARVPGAPLARSVQELINLGWEPATAAELWKRR